jgi:DNA invertase Pin-like site-specific DNA recombinase
MSHIGYIRVSKHEQNEALQMDALLAAGCEQFYTDKITGSTFERQGLDEALAYLRYFRHLCGVEAGSCRAVIEASY